MPSVTEIHPQPETIEYKGLSITVRHNPELNDFRYEFKISTTMRGKAPRRDAAIKRAKKDIDVLIGAASVA